MAIKFTNNASSTLQGALTSTDTVISVASGTGARFPQLVQPSTDFFVLTLTDDYGNFEIVKVTATEGDAFTVVRGYEDTTPMIMPEGALCELRLTAGFLSELRGSPNTGVVDITSGGTGNAIGHALSANTADTADLADMAESVSSIIPISNGGTGANSVASARKQLHTPSLDEVSTEIIGGMIVRRLPNGTIAGASIGGGEGSSVVTEPVVTGPAVVTCGVPTEFTMEARALLNESRIAYFLVQMSGGVAEQLSAVADRASYMVNMSTDTVNGSAHHFLVTAVDIVGNSSKAVKKEFTTTGGVDKAVLAPVVTSPFNGEKNVSIKPTITVAAIVVVGGSEAPDFTQIQVATDVEFKNIVATYDSTYTTSWVMPTPLGIITDYFVRARHSAAGIGWGKWGFINTFETVNAFVNAPSITAPADGAVDVVLKPTFTFSPFSNVGPADTLKTRTVTLTKVDGDVLVGTYEVPLGNPNSFTIAAALDLNTSYKIQVKDTGTLFGDSELSSTVTFRTIAASLEVPYVVSPSNGAGNLPSKPTITVSTPVVVGQTVSNMQVRISSDEAGTVVVWDSGAVAYASTITCTTALTLDASYFVRARYNGSVSGWTEYGPANSFAIGKFPIGYKWEITTSQTWTPPIVGAKYGIALWGGGGAGGHGSGGGGGGGYVSAFIGVMYTSPITITLGVGGAPSLSGDGLSGNPSSISGAVTLTANGGSGGGSEYGTGIGMQGGIGGSCGAGGLYSGASGGGRTDVGPGSGGGFDGNQIVGSVDAVGGQACSYGQPCWVSNKPYLASPLFSQIPEMSYGSGGLSPSGIMSGASFGGGGGGGYGNGGDGGGYSDGSAGGRGAGGGGGSRSMATRAAHDRTNGGAGGQGICVIVLMEYPQYQIGHKWEITTNQTWTPPIPNAKYGIMLWGGGGGGGAGYIGSSNGQGGGGGGGGAGYTKATITEVGSSGLVISIGRYGTHISDGTASTVGSILTAAGGGAGSSANNTSGGAGGSGGSGGGGGGFSVYYGGSGGGCAGGNGNYGSSSAAGTGSYPSTGATGKVGNMFVGGDDSGGTGGLGGSINDASVPFTSVHQQICSAASIRLGDGGAGGSGRSGYIGTKGGGGGGGYGPGGTGGNAGGYPYPADGGYGAGGGGGSSSNATHILAGNGGSGICVIVLMEYPKEA